ncbi:hypothetical protein [Palleronia sp.]|uniref:hypothetical protein n=1 Tax=Palleronia sp. TaxID=1940284 RepID=UPI0035C86CEA
MLRLALAFCLVATTAAAQDVLAQARSTYADIQGEWAEPGKSCANPTDTWSFRPGSVRAGQSRFDLLGIGGGAGGVRVDLVSLGSGARVPLNLVPRSGMLDVTGSGIAVSLRRCLETAQQFSPPTIEDTRRDDAITSRPLDEEPQSDAVEFGPSAEDLRQALGDSSAEIGTGPDVTAETSAEDAFAARFSGAWASGAGACDWRLSEGRIMAAGESYDVVNYSGSPDRIGVQALRSDGAPATFTVTPSGAGAKINGMVAGGDSISATLSPC